MMENGSRVRNIIAGLFFCIGLGLIGFTVFMIGLDRGLVQPKFEVIVLFNQVGGLVEGAPIRISGVNVGTVGSIEFLDQPISGRSLKVTMRIFKKYEFQFRKCSKISVKTEGVLGQKLIETEEDHKRKVFDLTKPLIGEDPLDVEDMAGVITRTAMSIQSTSDDLKEVLGQWKLISGKTKRLIGRVEERVIDGTLFKIF